MMASVQERLLAFVDHRTLIITDFDGTIAPIVALPDQARAHPDAAVALSRLAGAVGGVLILTGRTRPALLRAWGGELPRGVRALCNYGADDPDHPMVMGLASIAALRDAIVESALPDGVLIEPKGTSLALHTRSCRDPQLALAEVRAIIEPIASVLDLDIQQGRDVIDVGIRHGGKPATVARLLRERACSGVLMFGDDHSDLDAFDVLAASIVPSLTVGVLNPEVPDVEQRSDLVVSSPDEVIALMLGITAAVPNAPR